MVRFPFRRRTGSTSTASSPPITIEGAIVATRSSFRQQQNKKQRSSGWTGKRTHILTELLLLAKQNGVYRDGTTTCDNSSCGSNEAEVMSLEEQLQVLRDRFPTCPDAELTRFLRARQGNLTATTEKLQEYMDWRELHGLDTPQYQRSRQESTTDEQDWNESCELALKWQKQEAAGSHQVKVLEHEGSLPQVVFVYSDENGAPKKTLDDRMVIHILPARIDKKIAPGETYALAMGIYLDRKFDRENLHLATLLLDVRGGQGWPNPPAYNMMPFIRSTTSLLHQHYPERLGKTFIYPLPRAALCIWEMARPFLNKAIIESVTMISGSDRSSAPPPNSELSKYITTELLEEMEAKRLSFVKNNAKRK